MGNHIYTDMIKDAVEKYSNKPCMHIKRNGTYSNWTYADYHNDLNRIVSALRCNGFKDGCNGIVIGPNTPEWVIAYHGIMLAGGCTVPVDPNLPADEIKEILTVTKAHTIFCSNTYLSVMKSFQKKFKFIKTIVLLEQSSVESHICFNEFLDHGKIENNAFNNKFSPDDPVSILFTSGTTGKSKGVVLMQKNYTAPGTFGISRMKLNQNDTMIAVLPLYHVFGFAACIAAAMTKGLNVVFVPEIKGPLIIEALKDKKVTVLPAVPKMLMLFFDNIELNVQSKGVAVGIIFSILGFVSATLGKLLGMNFRAKLFGTVHKGFGGHLRKIVSGGASLEKRCFNGFRKMGFNIVEGYGLTETFGPITLCPVSDQRLGSVGPTLSGNEIKISNPDKYGVGEVLLKGEAIFKEYYNNDKATKTVFDNEGWFHSGDLGKKDKKGFLYLSGRSKDVIVLESGKNVYPDELEDYYSTSNIIEELGVFGTQIKKHEIIAAVIVPTIKIIKQNSIEKAQEIINKEVLRMGKNRPGYKKITDAMVTFQPLPRTSTKKIKKHELQDIFHKLKESPGTSLNSSEKLTVIEEKIMASQKFKTMAEDIKSLLKNKKLPLTPKTSFEIDLSIDSLKFLDIICAVEETFDISIPENSLTNITTLGDLYVVIIDKE